MPLSPEFSASRRAPSRTLRFGAISRRSNRTSPTTNATQTTAGGVRAARSFNLRLLSADNPCRARTLRSATTHVLNASARNRLCRTHSGAVTAAWLKSRLTRCAVFASTHRAIRHPAAGRWALAGAGTRPGPAGAPAHAAPSPTRTWTSRAGSTRRPRSSPPIVAHPRAGPGRRPRAAAGSRPAITAMQVSGGFIDISGDHDPCR